MYQAEACFYPGIVHTHEPHELVSEDASEWRVELRLEARYCRQVQGKL